MKERLRSIGIAVLRWTRPFILLGLLGGVFYLGIRSERTGFVREVLDPGLKSVVLPVLNAFRGSGPEAPQLDLLIGTVAMDSMSALRGRALKAGVLTEGKDAWFPTLLVYEGDTLSGRLRLKGGLTDHLRTNKWSFRVQLDEGDTLMGMTVFSLQHPNTRNFGNEWLFHRAVASAGLPALHYSFFGVRINTNDRGLYAVEQHFDDALMQRLAPMDLVGPVMKFDDELRIATLAEMGERTFDSEAPLQGDWLSAPITAFQLDKVLADSAKAARFTRLKDRLTRFRNGQLQTHDVFDADALAKLFALSDVFGAQHSNDWRNLRFAMNASTGKLVPIAFDANAGEPIEAIRALREQPPITFDAAHLRTFYGRLWSDRGFHEAYIAHLDTFSTDGWLEGFLRSVQPELAVEEELITHEFPNAGVDTNVFVHCRTVARQTLRPANYISVSMLSRGEGTLRLAIANLHSLPVEVVAIGLRDAQPVPCGPVLLPPRSRDTPLIEQEVELPFSGAGVPVLHIRLVGLAHEVLVPVKGVR